jgi:hypothetical protein
VRSGRGLMQVGFDRADITPPRRANASSDLGREIIISLGLRYLFDLNGRMKL